MKKSTLLLVIICFAITVHAQSENYVYEKVETGPTFPGCEKIKKESKRKICADGKMLKYIYSQIKYPPEARANKIEGRVIIRFIVEKEGSITNAEVLKDIGMGCGEEALRVIKTMPKWNPGMQDGKPVRVHFNLPVYFKLE